MKKFNKVLINILKFYKKYISPALPKSCRFYPTCSQYAMDAIGKHGFLKGCIKSIYRILRCNPFNRGGYDPA
ncbi:MAG: membrane protein insertion efficiency factor YidD [Actinobacteria bacterium]|nr:membrane protein insertion efficiency factor YidD [Actinomycetota bacterium]